MPVPIEIGMELQVVAGMYSPDGRGFHGFNRGDRVRVRAVTLWDFTANVRGQTLEQVLLTPHVRTLDGEEVELGTPTPRQPIEEVEECGSCGDSDGGRCEHCSAWLCCISPCAYDSCDRCRGCCNCEEPESGPIYEAHCRNYPRPQPAVAPYKGFLYLGVELEVECGEDDRESVASEIAENHSRTLILKEDGSLSNGFEMVTGPFALEVHQKEWPKMAATAIDAGARSWKHSTTGLHVHLSRAFFTPLVLGKLLVFLNSTKTRPHLVRLAGRESPDYAAMKKKELYDVFRYRMDWDEGRRCEVHGSRRSTRCEGGGARYEVLNLLNDATVEIRLFKGTLNVQHILANIEFAHAAAHWTTECSIQECEDWGVFWAYVLNHKKLYRNLVGYCAAHPRTEA